MEQVEFQPSRSLLKAVLTRQAGDWRKGLLELVQNAIDATRGTEEPRIEFTVDSHTLTCSDNGTGIGNTREEIIRRFAVFGDSEKRDDDATLGHFGIGRFQRATTVKEQSGPLPRMNPPSTPPRSPPTCASTCSLSSP